MKSNMQLLISGRSGDTDDAFGKSLNSYKYRDNVKLIGMLKEEELANITASAYAFVYPDNSVNFTMQPLEAMRCGVPVITSHAGAIPEICGDAALYCNPDDFNDIAEKMIVLYKDENKRDELIKKGFEQAMLFTMDNCTELLWQTILKCTRPVN